ncbi:hypothetical protein TNCV_815991 [Trichonephila clavipes]|nr:hypothetical protein TNCV_815991 [Trichonephila clavipes]
MATCENSVFLIHKHLQTMYCEEVMLRQGVGHWCWMFNEEIMPRMKIEMVNSTSPNEINIAKVSDKVLVDKLITVIEWR